MGAKRKTIDTVATGLIFLLIRRKAETAGYLTEKKSDRKKHTEY